MSLLTSEGFKMGSIISYHSVSAEHDNFCVVSSGNGAPTGLENVLTRDTEFGDHSQEKLGGGCALERGGVQKMQVMRA